MPQDKIDLADFFDDEDAYLTDIVYDDQGALDDELAEYSLTAD